jgi:hypothetical protein
MKNETHIHAGMNTRDKGRPTIDAERHLMPNPLVLSAAGGSEFAATYRNRSGVPTRQEA